MNKKRIIVLILVIVSGIFYYNLTEDISYEKQQIQVTRIIDGDTIEDSSGQSYRLLGINTPERNQPYYEEAKQFLLNLIENKTVSIEFKEKDKYSRVLTYIYFQNKQVNSELLKQGLATLYVYEKDENYKELEKAEKYARDNNLNLWKKSEKYGCIKLINLKYNEGGERCTNQEQLILENSCNSIQVIIKDDANHIYKETINQGLFTKNFSCIWNDEGDSLYVRDEKGLLLFYRY